MNSTARDIREAYFQLLNGQVNYKGNPIPFYNQFVPVGETPNYYVLFSTQAAYGNGQTKQSFNTDSTIQLSILSKELLNNSGDANEEIGKQILNLALPSPVGSVITSGTGGFQVTGTELLSDITTEGFDDGQMRVIQRVLVFQHKTSQIA